MIALIVAIGIYPNLVFRVTDGAVDASLHECLQVNASELTSEQAEALGCADIYDVAGADDDDHADEHAAVGG